VKNLQKETRVYTSSLKKMEFYCPSQKEVEQKYILILTDHVFGSAAVIISHRFIVFTVFLQQI